MNIPEPDIKKGQHPEQLLQRSLVAEIQSLLTQAGSRFLLVEGFGLDIAVFIQQGEKSCVRFVEVKAFVGSRGGGVNVGDKNGKGTQIDLLLRPLSELSLADSSIRWVLGMGTLPPGSPRYALFTTAQAKSAMMGQVARDKQNNLRVADFRNQLITWGQLSELLRQFLLG